MKRLNKDLLEELRVQSAGIALPGYDRSQKKIGIVHLGIGAFHRAHQAVYTDKVMAASGGDWGILGVSLRSAAVREQLAPQDGLYTVLERGSAGDAYSVIGSVLALAVAPENPGAVIDAMADSEVKIVSLTVTEKGYCHDPASGNLNLSHPDIVHDLKNITEPKTAIGFIVAALAKRREQGTKSFTAMSCDNLPNNGKVLKNCVLQFAKSFDEALAMWIASNTSFPCTMVDRIVPATTDADRDALEKALAYRDEGVVCAEPFSQWVIEDDFCNDRPGWEECGALIAKDVELYEKMKLRLLNGSHSLLAYCGYLAGKETISDVMQEAAFVNMCTRFMTREVGETLQTPNGFDIEKYQGELRERFANPGLRHRTWQIAMDGSQKIPQRWLEGLRVQLSGKGHIDIYCLGLAAWIRYVSAVDEKGNAIDVQDPLAKKLKSLHEQHGDNAAELVNAFLAIDEVFSDDLQDQESVVLAVCTWLDKINERGMLAVIKESFGSH